MDAIIVGGGIIGLACARELARAGMKVELLERLPAGAEASLAAAGMLSPMAETLPGPLLDACRESRDLWLSWAADLAEETGLSVEHDASGALLVALDDRDEAWLDRIAAEARSIGGVGEPVEEIDGSTLSRWVPDASPAIRRSLLLPGEHRVDNVQACAVLAIAARKAGAVLTYGVHVEGIERAGFGVRVVTRDRDVEADLLVLAAGAWSGKLMSLPVHPVRGQMLLLGGVDWPWSGSFRSRHGYAVRRGATGLLVGATVEEAGFASYNTPGGVESLLRFTKHTLPGLDNARLETTWAGLRPGTPDGLPILGPVPGWPVIAATGHYRNGILLAPWTAREVARLAASPDVDEAGPFSPARFASRMG